MKDLDSAKKLRAAARTAAFAAQARATKATNDLEVRTDAVEAAIQARTEAIAASKPDRVLTADESLQRARVLSEIASHRASSCLRICDSTLESLREATEAVLEAANLIRLAERDAMLKRFTTAMDLAVKLGTDLEFFAGPIAQRPADLIAALAMLPRPDPIHTPVNVLRGFSSQRRWDARLLELAADDQPEESAVA